MTYDEMLAYCLAKPGAWQDEPWEGDIVVKVGGKIFAFLGGQNNGGQNNGGLGHKGQSNPSVGVKCGATREAADEWLHRYPEDATKMAYIGRSGWNTLALRGKIPKDELIEAVDTSYEMVVSRLPRRERPS